MKKYELTFIVKGQENIEKTDSIYEETRQFIQELNGSITNAKKWGSRKLAYVIDKLDNGVYYTLNFDFDPFELKKLQNFLKLHKEILRHLLIESYKKVGTFDFSHANKKPISKEEKPVVDIKEREKKLAQVLEKILEE